MISKPPYRKKFSYTQSINATPDIIFPLLCPIREIEWVRDWPLVKVFSNSGVAEPECVFITNSEPNNSIWIISKHDPKRFQVGMYKVTPNEMVTKLDISMHPKTDQKTEVSITYEYTAISKTGINTIDGYSQEWYNEFMQNWENSMNHYISTGKILEQ